MSGTAAFVIGARQFQRLDQPLRAQCRQTCVVEIEVLEAPAHLFPGQRLLAVFFLGQAQGLDVEDAVAVVLRRP